MSGSDNGKKGPLIIQPPTAQLRVEVIEGRLGGEKVGAPRTPGTASVPQTQDPMALLQFLVNQIVPYQLLLNGLVRHVLYLEARVARIERATYSAEEVPREPWAPTDDGAAPGEGTESTEST